MTPCPLLGLFPPLVSVGTNAAVNFRVSAAPPADSTVFRKAAGGRWGVRRTWLCMCVHGAEIVLTAA